VQIKHDGAPLTYTCVTNTSSTTTVALLTTRRRWFMGGMWHGM